MSGHGHEEASPKGLSRLHKMDLPPSSGRGAFGKLLHDFSGPRSVYHFLWAWAGAHLHDHPSKKAFVIGITGTKGKTSTLELLNAILEASGRRTALISSLRMKIGDHTEKNTTGNSMPGRAYVQKFMKRAERAGCKYILVEVTSQAVVQHRHRFIQWNMGALTNLAPEHIESHGSFENYREAKLDFLRYVVMHGGKVFLNRDDKNIDFFMEKLGEAGPITFSRDDEFVRTSLAQVRTAHARTHAQSEAPHFLMSPFNGSNIAAAAAIAHEIGIPMKTIEGAMLGFRGVPGRMEYVKVGDYTAVVDYAHTPDSLDAALTAAKPKSPYAGAPAPKLICVIGAAGGGRDTWKRPAMGGIAAEHCDEIVITNEDPYDEDPQAIMDEIDAGIPRPLRAGQNIYKIVDRTKAIEKAASLARPGDVIVGTGKGSEDWIHIAHGAKIPWNEREAFEKALKHKQ